MATTPLPAVRDTPAERLVSSGRSAANITRRERIKRELRRRAGRIRVLLLVLALLLPLLVSTL